MHTLNLSQNEGKILVNRLRDWIKLNIKCQSTQKQWDTIMGDTPFLNILQIYIKFSLYSMFYAIGDQGLRTTRTTVDINIHCLALCCE